MKVNLGVKPDGEPNGLAEVLEFPSDSRPGMKHYVMVFHSSQDLEDEFVKQIKCSCEGFQNHHHCWHVRVTTERLNGT